MLVKAYPSSFYTPYELKKYDLCFQCHSSELLDSQGQTNFRNGIRNLHGVHVSKKYKGRTCSACHNVHVSDGEKLINSDGVVFGDWKIPIKFEYTETGGSCMPGCHRRMEYDRKSPADNSEKRKKEDE
jgi:predicted CXXCH cytochrome family protein